MIRPAVIDRKAAIRRRWAREDLRAAADRRHRAKEATRARIAADLARNRDTARTHPSHPSH